MAHIQEVPRKTRGSHRGRGGRALVVCRVRYRRRGDFEIWRTFVLPKMAAIEGRRGLLVHAWISVAVVTGFDSARDL